MKFSVRCYQGPDRPQNGYVTVEAESAKEAAEKACGEALTDRGPRMRLRATVLTQPPGRLPTPFYAVE